MISHGQEYVLEMNGIVKRFPGVLALNNMNFKLRRGSVHVLVGENGAGKSTLMKILNGEYSIDAGSIVFKGNQLPNHNAAASLNAGISMIHQELSPIRNLTIGENIFLGREPLSRGGWFVDFARLYADADALFRKLGIHYDSRARMGSLSVAGMQLIEIAKAISRDVSLVIMDEPTSALTGVEVDILFAQIRELKKRGVAIIYITHKLDEIFAIADEITVMRDGEWVANGPVGDFTQDRLISLMVGRTITDIFPKVEVPIGEEILRVEGLSGRGFERASFTVRAGEIVGLTGLIGAGRTEIARALFGIEPARAGRIVMRGSEVAIRNPRDAIRHGIAMISEDRKEEGLVIQRSVRENISLASLKQFAPGLFIDGRGERRRVAEMIGRLRVKVADMETPVGHLSGGNQQKAVIAKWILGDVGLLILDEPTRGIDVGSKSEIHALMCQLAEKGLGILMISSELPEILGMSDRIVVMHEGRIKGELPREQASQKSIMVLAMS